MGDKNWEEWRGGVWGCALPSWGLGLAPRKKNQFCANKNYATLSKFWYFFPILQHKNFQPCKNCYKSIRESGGGGLSPILKVGDLSPCPPCSDAYGLSSNISSTQWQRSVADHNWNCIGKKSFRLNSRYIKFAKVNVFVRLFCEKSVVHKLQCV